MCFRGRGFYCPERPSPWWSRLLCPSSQARRHRGPRHRRLRRNTEGLISKQLFHRLHNPNPIASKTHEHKSVLVGRQGHRRTNVANTRSSSRGPRQELQSWHTSRKADTFAPVLPGGDIEARCLLEQVMLAGAEDEQVMPPPRAAPRRAASAHAPRRRGALRARLPRCRRGALRRAAARTCAPRRGR